MAVSAEVVTVGTSATALNSAGSLPTRMRIVTGSTTSINLGGSGVTTTTGFPVATDTEVEVPLMPGDVLFAVAGSSTDVTVLRT